MIRYNNIILFISFISILLQNCTPNVVHLQEVNVVGPSYRNPVKIVNNKERGNVDVNINLSINNKKKFNGNVEGHTKVNESGIYELEEIENENYYYEYADVNKYEFEGENYVWNTPSVIASLNLDITMSKYTAITLGANYSSYENDRYLGYNIGFGFFQQGEDLAYRVDAFLKSQEYLYDITYIKVKDIPLSDGSFRKVYLYNEQNKDSYFNTGLMFSLNSVFSNWPINFFANYSLGWQTFYDVSTDSFYNDDEVGDFEHEEYYHSISLGIYQNAFENGRISLGYTLTTFDNSNRNFILPNVFVQYDILF